MVMMLSAFCPVVMCRRAVDSISLYRTYQPRVIDRNAMSNVDSRPPLKDGETYISTSYKARIMGSHIAKHLESHRSEGKKGPLMVGLQGPQGCGKS
jgi:hypothetical protein